MEMRRYEKRIYPRLQSGHGLFQADEHQAVSDPKIVPTVVPTNVTPGSPTASILPFLESARHAEKHPTGPDICLHEGSCASQSNLSGESGD